MEASFWREMGSVSSRIERESRLVVEGCAYTLVVWSLNLGKSELISWKTR
jgi:hypothetical protein